jgi:hypothetical protein
MNQRAQRVMVILVACGYPALACADPTRLADNRYGSLRIGMRLADIRIPLERPFRRTVYNREGTCFYVSPRSDPDLNLMIEHGVLTRIEVLKPGIKTSAGVAVGDPISSIKDAYGVLAVETPNAYDNEQPDFTVRSKDGRYATQFGTNAGIVTYIIAGRTKSVAYMEGCL